ncbi:MAG: asparagine synthase (glutamine-hydrolyzing), partial [Thermodesulfovibrionia bacterium]|nr:asparagine synthase (glutamine-hydrolyzing) [Thermodesulfovibrionia bacterium]
MCGVFGFFSSERKINRDGLSASVKAIHHRGPDNTGVVCFDGHSNSYLPFDSLQEGEWSSVMAHTRLSIIDLSEAANQPMSNEDGSVWIVYNGEIYNFRELSAELKTLGHTFKSRTDSEVIIHGYEEWGAAVVDRLRGMFAFAVMDRRANKLFLARDRLGVKPLKYFFDGRTFMFASELKGLMHLVSRRIDTDSLNRFLTLKYVPSPNTILEGVKKLAPAELLELDMNSWDFRTRRYWKPEFVPKGDITFDEAKDSFERLLSESVYMRTVSDVPIGVYLSGGMDSSAIVAFLKKNGIDDINTFTIKFNRPGYDESEYAKIVANRFRTTHHEFSIPELTFDEINKVICSLDEPFGDPSYIPTYFLSRITSDYVKVILSGDGGDEILGGYKRYYIYSRGRVLDYLPRTGLGCIRRMSPEINKKSFAGKIQRINEELSLGYWSAYLLRFNGLSDSFKRYVMNPGAYSSFQPLSVEKLISNFNESGRIKNTIERLQWIDLHTYLPDYILTKTDLALMSHSVEGRNPFVDYRL